MDKNCEKGTRKRQVASTSKGEALHGACHDACILALAGVGQAGK